MSDIVERLREYANWSGPVSSNANACMLAAAAEIERLRAQRDALVKAAEHASTSLQHAIAIIEKHVPRDALGTNGHGDPAVPGGFESWPLLDEYLHYMRESVSALAAAVADARGAHTKGDDNA